MISVLELRKGIQFALECLQIHREALDTITKHSASEQHDLNSSSDYFVDRYRY